MNIKIKKSSLVSCKSLMRLSQIRFYKKFLGSSFFGDAVDTHIHEELKNELTKKFEEKGRICDSLLVLLVVLFLALFSRFAIAAPIISGISTNEINIDTNFTGTEVLLFGAKGDAGNVIVTVRGPKKDYILNQKDKLFGIWYNKNRFRFNDTYSYYSFFSSNKDRVVDDKLLSELEIGKDKIIFDTGKDKIDSQFKIEFVNKLEQKNLYLNSPGGIDFLNETLFKVILKFPKNIVQGTYIVDIYLIEEDKIIAFQAIPIYVNQVGFSSKVNRFAHENSVAYGILAIMIAVISGFLVNYIFNKFFFQKKH